jgi:predicted O-methyltransferase YrrM
MAIIVNHSNRLVYWAHRFLDSIAVRLPFHRPGNCATLMVPIMYGGIISERSPTYVYESVRDRIEKDRTSIEAFLAQIRAYCYHEKFTQIAKSAGRPGEPSLENGWFEGGDARAAYGIVAALRPKRIVEIGSGNSTKFMRRAIRDFSLGTTILSIDPAPRAEIDVLCDTVVRKSVVDVDLDVFRELEPGDILFHDGSHITFNGSDTVKLFLEIFPVLRPGVVVHIHDINLPFEYSREQSDRAYSEQYVLAAVLLESSRLEVVLPVSYLGQLKQFDGGQSFWVRIR